MASGAHLEWHAWNLSSDQHWRLPLHYRCQKPSKAARNESDKLTQFQEKAPKSANLCNMLQLCNERKRHWRHWCKKCKVLTCKKSIPHFRRPTRRPVKPGWLLLETLSATVECFPDTSHSHHSHRRSLHRKLGQVWLTRQNCDIKYAHVAHVAHVAWEKRPKAANEPIISDHLLESRERGGRGVFASLRSRQLWALYSFVAKIQGFSLQWVGQNCLRHGIHPEKLRKMWS